MNTVMKLRAVLNTLEGVQVAGRENWDRMLGSMQAIEEVIQALSAPPRPKKRLTLRRDDLSQIKQYPS